MKWDGRFPLTLKASSLCRQIEESGIRALQLGLGNGEVLDTAFVGFGLADGFSTPEDAQGALRDGLSGMVSGTHTPADVIEMVDAENASPPAPPMVEILGTATADFSLIETNNFVTDAMRAATGCEIALFLDNGKGGMNSGKGLCGRLYAGDQTTNDITRILPDWRAGEKGELQKITMTGENLLNALEHTVPVDNDILGWFYYFSGL